MFRKDGEAFFTSPEQLPPPQPPPNVDLMKVELAKYKADMGDAQKRDKMGMDAQLEQMRQKLEADKVQFQAMADERAKQLDAMMESVGQQRDLQVKAVEARIDAEAKERQAMIAAIAAAKQEADKGDQDKEKMVLQASLDQVLEQQRQQGEQNKEIIKAMLAPREIVRDSKGKAKGTQISKE